MRDKYSLTLFFKALQAWDSHKVRWLKKMQDARQPAPTDNEIDSYRAIFCEGYLEALADAEEQQNTES